ncbi:hypothetical protein EIP91_009993 [Steccherinum ochraceum]|uniref:D-isomer specific 2-hydroxyacid dehydrogenase NAD-binding domain-containing protein n=1 Tax=Steccherinum ochraceum TaxID=92696 RepID=A0A4R0RT46_9APHY|nr:hypothetical protein EIP91_009993 [Steccherinum ochraceum]
MADGQRKMKVVVTLNLGPKVMPLLYDHPDLDIVLWPHAGSSGKQWLLDNIPGADGCIVMLFEKVDEEAAGPNLKVVSTMTVGYDHVDVKALTKRRIKLGNTPDVLTEAVADASVMLALMAGRNTKEGTDIVQQGKARTLCWSCLRRPNLQRVCSGQVGHGTLGFIGFGRIAQATLARMVGFGYTRCLYVARSKDPARAADLQQTVKGRHPSLTTVQQVELDQLARESDVLHVLAPGGPETYHIINEEFLKQMKRTAILVNTGRGTLVDSDALAKALREGWLWGAGVDVVEGEPGITADHPLVKEPRCVVIPHIGSATWESRIGMATVAAENLLAGLVGKPMTSEVQLPNVELGIAVATIDYRLAPEYPHPTPVNDCVDGVKWPSILTSQEALYPGVPHGFYLTLGSLSATKGFQVDFRAGLRKFMPGAK